MAISDLWNIGDSINQAFTNMTEMVLPLINDFKTILYGTSYNPFEVSGGFVKAMLFMYIFIIILAGSSYLIENMSRISNRATLKKTILMLIFVVIGIMISSKIEEKSTTKLFNMSLVYIKDGKDAANDDQIEGGRGFKTVSDNSNFNAQKVFGEDIGKKFLTFSPIEGFVTGDVAKSNLATNYTSNPHYQRFIVGMNPVFLKYSDISVKNTFLTNIDYLGINYTDLDSNIQKMINAESGVKFTKEEVGAMLDLSYKTDILMSSKENILVDLDKKISNNPNTGKGIKYRGKDYEFAGSYQDPKSIYKTDIIFMHQDIKTGQNDYVVIPYYDIVKFFIPSQTELGNNVFAFIQKPKDGSAPKGETKKIEIKPEIIAEYQQILQDFSKNITGASEILKFSDDKYDLYRESIRDYDLKITIPDVSEEKIKFIADYNVRNKNTDKYDIKGISDELTTLLKTTKESLTKMEASKTRILDLKKDAEKNKDEITKETLAYTTEYNKIKEGYIKSLNGQKTNNEEGEKTKNIFNALKINGILPLAVDFELSDTNYKQQVQDISTKLSSLESSIASTIIGYTPNEQKLTSILAKIEALDTKLPSEISITNKLNEPLYTVLLFVSLPKMSGSTSEFEVDVVRTLLDYICSEGKGTMNLDLAQRMKALNVKLEDNINCKGNNGKGEISNITAFKKQIQNLILKDIQTKFYVEEVNIIPYLSGLEAKASIVENLYETGNKQMANGGFLVNKIRFGDFNFVSPLVYYNGLINNRTDLIPGIFVNLVPIDGQVYTLGGVYNMKIGEVNSWYKNIDGVNGVKYSKDLSVAGIPLIHHLPNAIFALFTFLSYLSIYFLLIHVFLVVIKIEE